MLCSTCCSDQIPTCSSSSPTRNRPLFWLGTAPFHAPTQGCAIPNPQGGSSLSLPQAGLPWQQGNCLAPGNFLPIISSGTHCSINTWSTKSVPSNSRTAPQRVMLANTENFLVGEKFIEEPVFRKEEPTQVAVDTNSGSSWSWTSVI